MHKYIFKSLLILIFSIILLCGCVTEPSSKNKTNNTYDFTVDDDFTNETVGFNITCFTSITQALDHCENNTTINVKNGVYQENLMIEKPVILKGENASLTIIDGGNNKNDVIYVMKNGNLNMSGFTIRHAGREGIDEEDTAGIDLRSSNNVIKGNIIIENICGIYAHHSDNNIILQNVIQNNSFYGSFIYINSINNIFSNNVFNENYYALRIKSSHQNIVKNNVFVNNTDGLYLCCGSNYNIAYDNIFYNNSDWDAYDTGNNRWDLGSIPSYWHHLNGTIYQNIKIKNGNFWDSYYLETQGAFDQDKDGFIDSPYDLPHVGHDDKHPLSNPPTVHTPLIDITWLFNDIQQSTSK